jgi:hypothetical protein
MLKITGSRQLIIAMLITVLMGSTAVLAADMISQPRTEITPFIGWRFGGSLEEENTGTNIGIEDAKSFGLVIDYTTEPDKQIEIYISRQDTSFDRFDSEAINTDNLKKNLTIDYYHIGGVYLIPGETLRPFVSGTIGATYFNPEDSDLSSETKFSLALGTGVKFYATKHVGLRLEARGIYTFVGSNAAIFSNNGNLSIHVKSGGILQGEANAGIMLMF